MLQTNPNRSVCSSLKPHVSAAEWAARVELAAFYRIVARYGWSQLVNNHITLKVPGTADQFLLNPWGLAWDEVTASSLMKIDSTGKIILQPDHEFGINFTGYVIHGAIHEARPEVHCIAHTHTRCGVAVSSLECGLAMSNQVAITLIDNVAYHDYEGPAVDLDERERLVANLGTKDVLILRNHGLLTCGRTVGECFVNLFYAEASCRIQVDVMASGEKVIPLTEAALNKMRESIVPHRKSGNVGKMEWAAEVRWLDRNDTSYRE
jgi:ribulose-5-phosphate 4-epimerase/fuculose-1-phosphate aldolase